MQIPDNYNYIGLFLTMRCNYKCSYCINWKLPYEEMPGEFWIKNLNRLNTDLSITFGGGEPTLHKDFYSIINKLQHKAELLTNLSFNVEEFISRLSPLDFNNDRSFAPIRVSYHAKSMDMSITLQKLNYLVDKGFKVGLYCVDIDENREAIEILNKINNIKFETKPLLDNTIKEEVVQNSHILCKTKELLLAPDGNIFRCHRDLYKKENKLGNISSIKKINTGFSICNNYKECHPCDIKIKRDRFGNYGYCSVEKKSLIG